MRYAFYSSLGKILDIDDFLNYSEDNRRLKKFRALLTWKWKFNKMYSNKKLSLQILQHMKHGTL